MMYVARILYPVKVLGPGNRIGIWFAGCVHHCRGCSNPELWNQPEKYKTDVNTVIQLVNSICEKATVDGFTITGGDPFYQSEALQALVRRLQPISEDILVYTGYDYEALPKEVLSDIAVLIDGRYIESRNRGEALRGSDNQRIIYLKEKYRSSYEAFILRSAGKIQNFATRDGIISAGIHLPGYEQRLNEAAREHGLEAGRYPK